MTRLGTPARANEEKKMSQPTPASPFHEGEQRVQTRLGVREEIEPWAQRVVRPYLPDEHRAFYAELPFLVVAARDAADRPWATLLAGEPGFVDSPDRDTLRIAAQAATGDALDGAFGVGADVGLLGIELESRRRNRVNGRVAEQADGGFALSVDQSFGNCPQYITERRWQGAEPTSGSARRGRALSEAQQKLIERADTFFIATGYREGSGESETFGMDASHRGGASGFVRVDGGRGLVFPDYAGNNHFNTIGNLLLDPRLGLLFVDFERGDLLQLTGTVEIDWDSREIEGFPGARRLVHVAIDEVVELRGALPLRWAPAGEAIRELRVVGKERESEDVTSFLFEARDGSPLPSFSAGQYLPIELEVPGHEGPVLRTYSLSGAPDAGRYRISVKRQPLGVASRHLHDRVEVGHFVSGRAARGEFVLDTSSLRPVVLVSAGVGVTTMASMLHTLAADAERPVWFVHGARDGGHHPLRQEVEHLAHDAANVRVHVAYSNPGPEDVRERDFHGQGRVDGALLEKLVPGLEADFYLCGPTGFMAAIQEQLEARGVPPQQIHSESFGPAA
jgi:ferredoxin-NADP reductase/predicted pyridoxine 5'-phosphate oxidase superfamily flavin-nucleotide-binding protein